MKLLVFDLHGDLAHFKKYYATTSALTYSIPPKISIYGMVGAILGLPKAENEYFSHFQDKSCLIGLQLLRPPASQRLGINLRPNRARFKTNPKPTMHEFVRRPGYRIFFHHRDEDLQNQLEKSLREHTCVFTPTLGLANLLCNFQWVGDSAAEKQASDGLPTPIHSVVPRSQFQAFGKNLGNMEIVEQTMLAIEMDTERCVTERDDILFNRYFENGECQPIEAILTHFYRTEKYGNIALF